MGTLGLSPIQMSIILGIATACSGPARLTIGYAADRIQKRPLVFAVSAFFGSVFYISLYFTPINGKGDGAENWTCVNIDYSSLRENKSSVTTYSQTLTAGNYDDVMPRCCSGQHSMKSENCTILMDYFRNLDDSNGNNWTHRINISRQYSVICPKHCNDTSHADRSNNRRTFLTFFVLYFLAQAAYSPLQSILDSLIHVALIRLNKSSEFGKCRVWGSVGFGLCAFSSGFMLDVLTKIGWKGRSVYSLNFAFLGLGLILSSAVTLFIAHSGNYSKNAQNIATDGGTESCSTEIISEENNRKSVFTDRKMLVKIFCSFYLSVVMLTGLVSGTISGSIEGFFYYFLASLDPNNKLVLGVSLGVACITEVTVLYFSDKIIKRLGYQKCLYLVFLTYASRLVASSFLTDPWFGPLIDSTQGLCFGLLYPVMSTWASSEVPNELHSTVQCYLGAAYYDLGKPFNNL